MLRDLKELLDEDDDFYPPPDDGGRRKYFLIGGIAGGALLLIILCIGVYAIFLSPDSREQAAATPTQLTERTVVAGLPEETASPTRPTDTPTPIPATVTPDPSPTPIPAERETATQTPTQEEATATSTELPLPTTTPVIIFEENFEGSGGIWPSSDRDTYQYGISDGQFRILVKATFTEPWTVRERVFEDVRLETDLVIPTSSQPGYAGLVCRFQDGYNFYAAIIHENREISIIRRTGNQMLELAGPETSASIEGQGSVNRLRFDCRGDQFVVSINGVTLLNASDDRYPEGQVGYVAGTLESSGFEAFFDNFVVAQP